MKYFVPQELVDQILDYLHDSPNALKACSFVSRSWLRTCRIHLHRQLCLESPSQPEDLPKFQRSCQLLASSPHLAPFIREFTLRGDQAGLVAIDDSILSIFKMLHSLRVVGLERLNWVDHQSAFELLPQLVKSDSVVSIKLSYCRFSSYSDFLPLVGNSNSLRALSVSHCTMPDAATRDSLYEQDVPEVRKSLRCLRLEGSEQQFICDFLLHPLSPVSVESLSELHLSTPIDQNFAVAGKILHTAGPALDSFNFDFTGELPTIPPHFGLTLSSGSIAHEYTTMDLTQSTNLRKLYLRGGSGRSAMFAGNTAVWSQALLTTAPSDSSLQEVTVCMRMDFVPLRGTHTNRWVDIEALLLQPRFQYLRRLHIHIITGINIEEYPVVKFVSGEMEQMMSTLYEKGVLCVEMESDHGHKEPPPVVIDWA
ncbi:hypothetical protein HGRIS_005463 [Hohenbuehelia grisea]|uniref:F-box domain-containing protein n=1 Tax=Hohenbuehelia grisea TaxID=104357 RepID=A0ABR3JYC8_9AGAR